MEKYGYGEVSVRKCETCDYEQTIHTAGAHINQGPAVMVYVETGEFVCPNCNICTLVDGDESK